MNTDIGALSAAVQPKHKDRVVQACAAYEAVGLCPIRLDARKKFSTDEGWNKQRITAADAAQVFGDDSNIGIRVGEPSNWVVDLDFDCSEARALADVLFAEENLPTFGRPSAPASHRLVHCPEAKSETFVLPPSLKDRFGGDEHGLQLLEIRSTGGQTMFPPSVHPSGEVVEWRGEGLKTIPEAQPAQLHRWCGVLAFVSAMAKLFPPKGVRNDFMMAVAGALAHAAVDGKTIQALVQRIGDLNGDKGNGGKWKVAAQRGADRVENGAEVTGLPTVCQILCLGDDALATFRKWLGEKKVDGEIEQHDVEHKPDEWSPLLTRDPLEIPRIPWEVPGFLLRRTVTLVNGHGGSGKSVLMLRIALACALNQQFAEWKPARPSRVLICNAEDGVDILDMRLEAALHEFDRADSRKLASENLLMRNGAYGAMRLLTKEADEKGRGTIRKTDFFQRLDAAIGKLGIGLLIFDPAISAHAGLDENSNADMQALHDAFAELARKHDIAVALVHHSSKSAVAGSQHGARGASALVDACRVVISVDPMSEEEAKLLLPNIDERASHFCVRESKQNYAIKRKPQWFKLTSVTLPNGETAPGIDRVDFDFDHAMSQQDMAAFLDAVVDGLPGGARYTKAGQDTCRLDAMLTRDFRVPKKQAKAVVKELVDAGILALESYVKDNRHKGTGFVVRHRPGEHDQLPLRGGQ